ncbi:tumor necrosis factor receptor superfamily member 18 [Halichoeres trimaculatus]|uniref:tumor necrosis factor receptor superfamily member 18 n=1 Tax=Halichoeres trimaculatus TaxID=147232 RepID=UPI003D9E28A8
MIPLSSSLVLICVWTIWTSGYAADCGERQHKVNGRCCDLCPPGEKVKHFCSEHQQTVCVPCEKGSFSDQHHILGICEDCQSCQEYAQKCTLTTNAKCSRRPGFLCSNSVCSRCEENKCVQGEKVNRTAKTKSKGLIEYLYQCEPLCLDTEYFDAKVNICRPRTQCSLVGLPERFPGNKTHNSVCEQERPEIAGDSMYVLLGVGFILLSLTLLILLSYVCIKKFKKLKGGKSTDFVPVSTKTSDFPLSKEESSLSFIIQDESKCSDGFCVSHTEVTT